MGYTVDLLLSIALAWIISSVANDPSVSYTEALITCIACCILFRVHKLKDQDQ